MVTVRCLVLVSMLLVAGCSSGPTQPLSEGERTRIKELSGLPPGDFLARYYLKSSEAVSGVDLDELIGRLAYRRLLLPREELSEYCALNGGNLHRLPGSQRSWSDTSPDRTNDASLNSLCDASAGLAACGVATASSQGAFGTFECRHLSSRRVLWSASIESSSIGKVVSQGPQMAQFRLTVKLVNVK